MTTILSKKKSKWALVISGFIGLLCLALNLYDSAIIAFIFMNLYGGEYNDRVIIEEINKLKEVKL